MEQICPVCQGKMEEENKIKYIDYSCSKKDDHYFAKRVKLDELKKIKIRFKEPDGEKLYLKINFDEGFLQVWTNKNKEHRVNIDHVFMPDFSQTEKLKNKIRTYLLFS